MCIAYPHRAYHQRQCYPSPAQVQQLQAASELVAESVEYTQDGYDITFPNIFVPAYGVVLLNIYP